MSKLFNLKEWLTVADAGRHLSIVFGEKVTEADVLRLALDGHLRLSVNFVNHVRARYGKIVGYEDAECGEFPAELAATLPSFPDVPYMKSLNIDDKSFLYWGKEVTYLHGVWDLPMIGGERLDIEHAYQNLIGGPSVTIETQDGAFVEGRDGQMCLLQESYDDNEFQAGSSAQLETLTQFVAKNNIEAEKAEQLWQWHKEKRKEFLEKKKTRPASENYYPAGSLPKDGVIVVRTEALREFEQTINGAPNSAEKPLGKSERNTLLTIIAAFCKYESIDPQGRGAAVEIMKMTDDLGVHVDDGTIRRWLKSIPDALESRMK